MSSKRHSILPAIDRSGPHPPVNFSSSIIISDNAILVGNHSVTIQAETIVHPRVRFETSAGSILVGRRCIIQERVHLGVLPETVEKHHGGVLLGDYTIVEVGTTIEAGGTEIGEGTTIQAGSHIGSNAKIGKHCTLSPKSVVPADETIPDHTIIYSDGKRRHDKRAVTEIRKRAIVSQIAVLKKLIPSNPEKFKYAE